MSDEQHISRRAALKVIAVGVGTTSALPILEETTLRQQGHSGMVMEKPAAAVAQVHRFFNAQEIATVAIISGLIIHDDEQSPCSEYAGVPAFIDRMVIDAPS